MNRRLVAVAALIAIVGAALAGLIAGGGSNDSAPPTTVDEGDLGDIHTVTTTPAETGGIVVPDIDGTFKAAVPDLGFGVAVPETWQATLLGDDALERLASAQLADPGFRDAAVQVAGTGALFYAAGGADGGQIGELKIDVIEGDSSPAGLAAYAQSVVDAGDFDDTAVTTDLPGGRVRVDYNLTLPAADGSGDIVSIGSQILIPDGNRIWSLIVTSEDAPTQATLIEIFSTSFVLSAS